VKARATAIRSPWAARRRRALDLREKRPFAGEVLTLYLALLDAQEPVYEAALEGHPDPGRLRAHVAREVLPRVIEATVAAGPAGLARSVVARFHSADLDDLFGTWLAGGEQTPVDSYLARAAAGPVLEALPADLLGLVCRGPRDARHCPHCGGPPQLAFFALSGEPLVTGARRLVCARCAADWAHPRLVCAACGEATGARLPVYSDSEQLPALRIDACETCRRYLLSVDARQDAAAVPVVDELAGLPLDLHARDLGLRKVVPNLMGF
jgi:formate dehydrogenase accessory protein FdhE